MRDRNKTFLHIQVEIREEMTAEGEKKLTKYCSYDNAVMWGIQKMLALRDTVQREQERFRFVTLVISNKFRLRWDS